MPSSRHSVLAKAARYRAEPDRVDILVSEPLVAVVHALTPTILSEKPCKVWSVRVSALDVGEGTCAHVLAVEHQRSIAASNAAVAEFGAPGLKIANHIEVES